MTMIKGTTPHGQAPGGTLDSAPVVWGSIASDAEPAAVADGQAVRAWLGRTGRVHTAIHPVAGEPIVVSGTVSIGAGPFDVVIAGQVNPIQVTDGGVPLDVVLTAWPAGNVPVDIVASIPLAVTGTVAITSATPLEVTNPAGQHLSVQPHGLTPVQGSQTHGSAETGLPVGMGATAAAVPTLPAAVAAGARVRATASLYGQPWCVVEGPEAHDAALTRPPVVVGWRADTTIPAAVSNDGDVVQAWGDVYGRLATMGYDQTSNANYTTETAPPWNRRDAAPVNLLPGGAQNFTGAAADLGGEINAQGYNGIACAFTLDINDGTDCRLIVVYKNEAAGALEAPMVAVTEAAGVFTIVGPGYYEWGIDADQNTPLVIPTRGFPYLQLMIYAAVPGATPAQMDAATYLRFWSPDLAPTN